MPVASKFAYCLQNIFSRYTIACIQLTLKFWLDNCLTDSLFRVVQAYVFSLVRFVSVMFFLSSFWPLAIHQWQSLEYPFQTLLCTWSISSFSLICTVFNLRKFLSNGFVILVLLRRPSLQLIFLKQIFDSRAVFFLFLFYGSYNFF